MTKDDLTEQQDGTHGNQAVSHHQLLTALRGDCYTPFSGFPRPWEIWGGKTGASAGFGIKKC